MYEVQSMFRFEQWMIQGIRVAGAVRSTPAAAPAAREKKCLNVVVTQFTSLASWVMHARDRLPVIVDNYTTDSSNSKHFVCFDFT